MGMTLDSQRFVSNIQKMYFKKNQFRESHSIRGCLWRSVLVQEQNAQADKPHFDVWLSILID